jgi:Lrp/AsnC family transcriptional regulator, leucine-responsive regulatory protein
MKKTLQNSGFDKLDYAILEELQANGRISVADLARKVYLSQPAVHNRIKRLEKAGVIKGYAALVDREAAGYDLLCFIRVSIQTHTRELFDCWHAKVESLPQVLECYRTAGSYDLLLKVVVADHKALDQFIAKRSKPAWC